MKEYSDFWGSRTVRLHGGQGSYCMTCTGWIPEVNWFASVITWLKDVFRIETGLLYRRLFWDRPHLQTATKHFVGVCFLHQGLNIPGLHRR